MPPSTPSPRSEAAALLRWFARVRRPLPWRDAPTPYAVWVSEIMLQQTRVETVAGYYARFMAAFPDVAALAAADIQDVLRIWQGLGYYSRARNLHRAATAVVRDHGGALPATAAELRALPGIGAYTAAAIASICHGERIPVVDGNVLRVAARRLLLAEDVRTPAARRAVEKWLAPRIGAAASPGDFNEALMELGETLCRPAAADCAACPWARNCAARASGDPLRWPVREAAAPPPVRRAVALALRRPDGAFLLVRRSGERFLGEMWELPGGFLLEGETPRRGMVRTVPQLATARRLRRLGTVRHAYSHFRLELEVYAAEAPSGGADILPAETGGAGILPAAHSQARCLRSQEGILPAACREASTTPDARWVQPGDLADIPLSKAPRLALDLAAAKEKSSDS